MTGNRSRQEPDHAAVCREFLYVNSLGSRNRELITLNKFPIPSRNREI